MPMLHESDLRSLLSQWKERLSSPHTEDYRCALGECIYDLQCLLDNAESDEDFLNYVVSHLPSEEVEQYLREQEADQYLSSMEAHGHVA